MSDERQVANNIWNFGTLLSIAVSILSLGIAGSSLYLSNQALDSSVQSAEANLYIEFKKQFADLQVYKYKVAKKRRDKGYIASPEDDLKGWRYFERYWEFSFNEWYATTQLFEPEAGHLWNEFYGPSIRDALTKSYFLQSICYLLNDSEASFRAHQKEFRKALIELYVESAAPGCLLGKN